MFPDRSPFKQQQIAGIGERRYQCIDNASQIGNGLAVVQKKESGYGKNDRKNPAGVDAVMEKENGGDIDQDRIYEMDHRRQSDGYPGIGQCQCVIGYEDGQAGQEITDGFSGVDFQVDSVCKA